MTDRFEDIVRDAAKNLSATSGSAPSYHDAWQRGRRRRFIKRSALAGAGALVLVAALMVNLGRVPGPQSNDTEEIVVGAPATTSTAVPTTGPVQSPGATPTATAVALPDLDDPTPAQDPGAAATGQALAAPTTEATQVPPAANPTPRPTVAPSPNPVPTVAPTASATPAPTPLPTSTAVPFVGDDPLPTPDPAGAAETQSLPTDESTTGPTTGPVATIAGSGERPADAVVVGSAVVGAGLPCDLDGDAVADASCELLADYPCTGDGDVRTGYAAVDADGDLVAETCRAVGLTSCDTTGDGQGDTPCIIELLPEPQSDTATPAGEEADPTQDPDGP